MSSYGGICNIICVYDVRRRTHEEFSKKETWSKAKMQEEKLKNLDKRKTYTLRKSSFKKSTVESLNKSGYKSKPIMMEN